MVENIVKIFSDDNKREVQIVVDPPVGCFLEERLILIFKIQNVTRKYQINRSTISTRNSTR